MPPVVRVVILRVRSVHKATYGVDPRRSETAEPEVVPPLPGGSGVLHNPDRISSTWQGHTSSGISSGRRKARSFIGEVRRVKGVMKRVGWGGKDRQDGACYKLGMEGCGSPSRAGQWSVVSGQVPGWSPSTESTLTAKMLVTAYSALILGLARIVARNLQDPAGATVSTVTMTITQTVCNGAPACE